MKVSNRIKNSLLDLNSKQPDYFTWFGILALAILIITVIFGSIVWYKMPCDLRGIFGNMFGALNAAFSGIALAALIVTVYMQMKELTLTREEFKKMPSH